MKLKPINQQVVAVVGASSGIGRVTALKFAEKGSKVVVLARSQSGLDSLVEEIRRLGGKATAIAADVADFEQVEAITSTEQCSLASGEEAVLTGLSIPTAIAFYQKMWVNSGHTFRSLSSR